MSDQAIELANKAEQFLLLVERIETDNGPAQGEWDKAKGELLAAIRDVRAAE